MSRVNAPEQIVVRPTNTVYTALVAICVVLQIVGLVILYMRHQSIFDKSIF